MKYRIKLLFALTVMFLSVLTVGCRKKENKSKPASESSVQLDPRTSTGKDAAETSQTTLPSGETLETVTRKLNEIWAGTNSMTADFVVALRFTNPAGDMATIGNATFEYQRKAGKSLYRQEIAYTVTNSRNGKELTRVEHSELIVNDGEFHYTLRKRQGAVTAEKWPEGSAASFDGRTVFEKMSSNDTMTYIGQKQVDGRGVYVFEGRPKKRSTREKTVVYFDMETGIAVKSTFLGWVRRRDSSVTFTNVKINPKIDPARFKFELPPGVEMLDQTNR